jgi:hypothetical protein
MMPQLEPLAARVIATKSHVGLATVATRTANVVDETDGS